MKKLLFQAVLLLTTMGTVVSSSAQTAASLPEAPLPTVPGPVLRPQNAGSSTMQNITYITGATNNLYVHSWDVFSSGTFNGIAWRRTDAVGTLLNDGYIPVKYANDIDVALYQDGSNFYVLAAYYYDDGTPLRGHYYDIYQFDPGGLIPLSTFNLLTLSSNFGRINVDANTPYGLAITWCVPGGGIYVKAASLPGAAFGPNVLLPGTSNKVDPDVCIRRGGGGSGTGLDLQLVFLDNTLNTLREYRLPFFNALAGSSAGFTAEYTTSTPSTNVICPPRIDCPDTWGVQKWTVSFGIYNVSGTTVTEWIYAAVKNDTWSPLPTTVNVRFTSYTTTTGVQPSNPVVAYNDNATRIHIGWMTKENTMVIPGTTDVKYVAQYVFDPGSSAPVSVPGSFMMISNLPGGAAPVLAFSGQNNHSSFNGLHTAYSQLNTVFPGDYSMMYKDKPWSSGTFRLIGEKEAVNLGAVSQVNIVPNPFVNMLSFRAPADGVYEVSLVGIDGRSVFSNVCTLEEKQPFHLSTSEVPSGIYFMRVVSVANGIDYTQKLIK